MGGKTLLQTPDYAEVWSNFWRIAAIDTTNNPWPALLAPQQGSHHLVTSTVYGTEVGQNTQQRSQSSWLSSPNSWNQLQFVPSAGSSTTSTYFPQTRRYLQQNY